MKTKLNKLEEIKFDNCILIEIKNNEVTLKQYNDEGNYHDFKIIHINDYKKLLQQYYPENTYRVRRRLKN